MGYRGCFASCLQCGQYWKKYMTARVPTRTMCSRCQFFADRLLGGLRKSISDGKSEGAEKNLQRLHIYEADLS
jgi:hypothetical protein